MQKSYEEIILVGHSKCGLCLTNTTRYCEKEIVLVTISAPYKGTVVADKKMAETILKNPLFIKIYNRIFSDHNVDKDIAPNSEFIQNMCPPVCREHINMVSSLDNILDCRNIVDIFLLFLDKIMKINGDGIVSFSSQKAISSSETIHIFCSHASSLKRGIEILNRTM